MNLLEESDDDILKFQTKKWHLINDQNNGQYGKGDENDSTMTFNTEVIKPNLCDYSDAYIVVTRNIVVVGGNQNTLVSFKNSRPFIRCVTHISDEHIDTAENLDIIMNLHNLIEYSDNYLDTSGSLFQYRRDEQNVNNAENIDNVNANDSSSFKYKSNLLKELITRDVAANVDPDIANAHRIFLNAQIVVPLKYLSNFFKSLEMLLINRKLNLELNWSKNSVMSNVATATTFQITSTKLYVPIVTLPTKENITLTKLLNKVFKRSVFWNESKSKIEAQELDNNNLERIPLASSFQGVNRLFVLAFDNTKNGDNRVQRNSHRKYFLRRAKITKCNVLIDGRDFYDQSISDEIRKYNELRKLCTGKGDDYTTGCLLDYKCFKDHYQLIACDLNKRKELDEDPRAIQQLEF